MNKELQWLKDNYKYLSIPAVEKDLKLARKTIYKYVTDERELPAKYHDQVIRWILDFKNESLTNASSISRGTRDSRTLYNKAFKAYVAACKRKNMEPKQPCELHSEITDELVRLRDESSLIATYNHRKERFLTSPTAIN